MRKGGKVAWTVAEESYKRGRAPTPGVHGLTFLAKTPTEVAYRDASTGTIYIGVRGTHSAADVAAWPLVPFNLLHRSSRYKRALAFAESVASQYPNDEIELSGHSLGGTIAAGLRRDMGPRVSQVHTYNQAVQPDDVGDRARNVTRHYVADDPLHAYLGGQYAGNREVIAARQGTALENHSSRNFYPADYAAMQQVPRIDPALSASNRAVHALATLNEGLSYLGVPGTAEASMSLYRRAYGGGGRSR